MARSLPGRGASAAAGEKRKKQVVLVGGVLLVVLLVFQFMRLSGGSPTATPTSAVGTTGATTGTPSTTAIPTGGAGATFATPPATRRALDRMPVNDPFVPLIRGGDDAPGAVPAEASPPAQPDADAPAAAGSESKAATEPPTGSTAPAEPAPKAAPPPPTAAILSVNGSSQTVGRSKLFPAKAPAFRLVAVTPTFVRIGVAGGAFTRGRPTIRIRRGETVTLVNTATGEQYVLRFAAPTSAAPEPAAEPAAEAPPAPATAPAEEGDE